MEPKVGMRVVRVAGPYIGEKLTIYGVRRCPHAGYFKKGGKCTCVTSPVSVPMVKKIGDQQLSFKWEVWL